MDALFAQAVDAGAKIVNAVEDQFYGDRNGTLEDPFGHVWYLGIHKEDLTPEEINKRAEELFKQGEDQLVKKEEGRDSKREFFY